MSSMSRGKAGKAAKAYRVVKPKKSSKHTTQHHRNHRFQSFNDLIENTNIHPIRRKRFVEGEETEVASSHSFFGESLQEWRDTNLSATFTAFAKEVAPLCDNLAGVLHNEDRIMDSLVSYIERGDALAMDALLSLLSHLAHDLDARFEKHFQRAVATITALAAKHDDHAVIEQSFTCLAWLLKYLSRLLTPDLRPLYDLVAPYLGKERQNPFIVRFTAESLSFLLRKTAATYERDSTPLDSIMQHMLQDCETCKDEPSADLQQQGIMALLTEAVRGVQNGIHTSGKAVLQCLLKCAGGIAKKNEEVVERLTTGIVTSLIHYCNKEGFEPVLDVLLDFAHAALSPPLSSSIHFASSLLFTAMSVRKGSRIMAWNKVATATRDLIGACDSLTSISEHIAEAVLASLAIYLTTSTTLDSVAETTRMLELLRSKKWESHFPHFCDIYFRLSINGTFDHLVLAQLKQFVSQQKGKLHPELLALIPRAGSQHPKDLFTIPNDVFDRFIALLTRVGGQSEDVDSNELAEANAHLSITPYLLLDDSQRQDLQAALRALVEKGLTDRRGRSREVRDFSLGPAFHHLLQLGLQTTKADNLWVLLCEACRHVSGLPVFWSNLLQFLKLWKPTNAGAQVEQLEEVLISCLAMPSDSIRSDVLDLIQQLYRLKGLEEPEILATAITIESTPIKLETARSISMNIRRLAKQYSTLNENDPMVRAIPTYCFGLLHVRLSQAWEDASNTLASICETKAGEEVVISLIQTWIDQSAAAADQEVSEPSLLDSSSEGFKVFSDFECPNLAKMLAIRQQVFREPQSGALSSKGQLQADIRHLDSITTTSRGQALKVLSKIPKVAERRSRILVPILLRWAGPQGEEDCDQETHARWARKDQKALLAIFAQFVNPKVLFRADEVFQALLALCANGDVEIQKSALTALLAWKNPSVARYKEHLNNLLDEERFREELSVFLQEHADDDEESEGIRPEDHSSLMPVLLRLLYGRAIAGGKEGQSGRRKALFVALSRFGEATMQEFLNIAFRSLSGPGDKIEIPPRAPLRQQLGLVNMINDMLQVLGSELKPFVSKILDGVLACTVGAEQELSKEDTTDQSLLRALRQSGVQCLVKVFANVGDFQNSWSYAETIAHDIVRPRLESFAGENAQSISGVLRLLAAWTASSDTVSVFRIEDVVMLESVAQLLQTEHTKDEVRLFILQELLDNLTTPEISAQILQPHISDFVKAIGIVLEQQPSKAVLDACVRSFSHLAGRITSQEEAVNVIGVCAVLLKRPSHAVSSATKIYLLRTILPLIGNFKTDAKDDLYSALCALYSRLPDNDSRSLLSQVLAALVRDDQRLLGAAKICADMNAMGSRLDEPDHGRRDAAYASVFKEANNFSLEQWLPLVHNFLYYIRDNDDSVARKNASQALRFFVSAVAVHFEEQHWQGLLDDAVFQGIERGIRDSRSTELVRAEYLAVLGHIVEKLPDWQKVSDMQILLVGGDEEASFFANALYIQQHRRLRALRRLGDEATKLASHNISKIFLPLLEHFIFDQAEGDAGRVLADQAVQTIGSLAKGLNKSAFRAVFQRYMGHLKAKKQDEDEDVEKKALRLCNAMVDGLQRDSDQVSAPIVRELLPPLTQYLQHKDESTVDRRIAVAVTIVKLMHAALPEDDFALRLPGVLLEVCHVLRSRSQEARDQTRKALTSISALIGPHYFGFIVKELRSALKRGYQLHVLSYTVHSLLVQTTLSSGDLDEVLSDIMLVIMDDIFGITGQEKDAEEYKSGMKEVKSSKSFDTMELLAKITPIRKLGELIRPIRSLLSERVDLKVVKKMDELLTRLRKGLDQNPESESRDLLIFCYEIVKQVYADDQAITNARPELDERRKRYIVQPEPEQKKKTAKGSTTSYRFKLTAFALNLLRKVLRRHEDLQTPQNMAGFLGMAGDGLIQGQEEVKLSAVRFLSTIMRVPLPQLEENAPVYVKEAVLMIKSAPDMTTESAKAALELITSVLREQRSVSIKEKDMALVLKRVKAGIDEPDRQTVIYKFLKAVIGRKIVITEVYEVMDEVSKAMVINPDRAIRESARSAYSAFIMDYPQGKDRWKKQTSFLVGNLQYEHAEGRKSVMEFIHQILSKIGDDVFEKEVGNRLFVSLLPVLVSDSSSECREMARLLVAKLFERASTEQLKKFLGMMETWTQSEKKPAVRAGALQCWSVLLKAKQLPEKQLVGIRDKLEDIISDCSAEDAVVDPQLALDALKTLGTLVETAPFVAFSSSSSGVWDGLQTLEITGDAEIDELVASLLGSFFTDFASTSSKTTDGLAGLPLRGSGGMELGAGQMRRLATIALRTLRNIQLGTSETLIAQIARNLVFLGRCFASNEMPWNQTSDATPAGSEEENEDDDEEETDDATSRSALSRLLQRLSSMLMADKFSVVSRTAALQTLTSLINAIPTIPALPAILRPLYALTDPSVPKPPGELHANLTAKAHETLDLIQKKVGSDRYLKVLGQVRTEAKARREERRQKRRIEAVSKPEIWAEQKRRKHEVKKIKIKEKGAEARGRRRGW
ncbi:uncharacterized protein MYCFIDRAFT_204211 [Pseudocercospora fijiensis CIRAD86]|uniref:Uncharacterized protein n=1 Tax=Pseudocercospora fijiensis (strain CIRAD86) TaxID=383855 RepID=M2YTU8_PSEFD|nr:uncharacterized protein MYCFIDRAFT_204211 [Pseudocercospora fijiensis CIRAD86]EME81165.1 hypothetical protein MYCFIDRAFT_204211 [Pseudocercospora fijiensis CIRAD86]